MWALTIRRGTDGDAGALRTTRVPRFWPGTWRRVLCRSTGEASSVSGAWCVVVTPDSADWTGSTPVYCSSSADEVRSTRRSCDAERTGCLAFQQQDAQISDARIILSSSRDSILICEPLRLQLSC